MKCKVCLSRNDRDIAAVDHAFSHSHTELLVLIAKKLGVDENEVMKALL